MKVVSVCRQVANHYNLLLTKAITRSFLVLDLLGSCFHHALPVIIHHVVIFFPSDLWLPLGLCD